MQTGQVFSFGALPNSVEQAQNNLVLVLNWAWTSSPITIWYLVVVVIRKYYIATDLRRQPDNCVTLVLGMLIDEMSQLRCLELASLVLELPTQV